MKWDLFAIKLSLMHITFVTEFGVRNIMSSTDISKMADDSIQVISGLDTVLLYIFSQTWGQIQIFKLEYDLVCYLGLN